MGILNGILRVKGNVGELVFVNFGQTIYVRRKRGTLKPATVNKKFQQNIDRNTRIMQTAKPINTILKEFAKRKTLGRFWSNMLGRLRKCNNDHLETHLQSLADLETNLKYELYQRVIVGGYSLKTYDDHVTVDLKLKGHASFIDEEANCYYYELIMILWDKDEEITQYTSIPTPWIYMSSEVPNVTLKFERTKWEKYYLFALKLQGGNQGNVLNFMPDQAMAILGGGLLE